MNDRVGNDRSGHGLSGAPADGAQPQGVEGRQQWLSVLARADVDQLEKKWSQIDDRPAFSPLRPAEVGLVMVRGRMGGTGRPFNMGEMTVTRCSVRADTGAIGHGYVAGRSRRHAELAAMFDALLQDPQRQARLMADVIAPLAGAAGRRRAERAQRVAGSRVDFFTMVRGED